MGKITIPKVKMPPVEGISQEPEKKKTLPLTGKMITAENPLVIGEKNFRQLTNMRYGDVAPKSIAGMTKISSSSGTYLKARNAFQFKKPTITSFESHVMAQMFNSGLTASQVLDYTTTPPASGSFSDILWTDSSGAGKGMFSKAPNSSVAYCNGVDACLWGGTESKVSRFINFSTDGDFLYDYTDIVNNTKDDSDNCVLLVSEDGGIDSDTKLLLHLDNNVTDTVGTHTVTNNNVTFTTTGAVFGYCASFNGTSAYLSIPDHADFDFSGGIWTLDLRGYFTNFTAAHSLYYQKTDVKTFSFNTGTTEPAVGTTYYQEAPSNAVIIVLNKEMDGGHATWDGTAEGDIYYQVVSGAIANGSGIYTEAGGGGSLICEATSDETDAGDNYIDITVTTAGKINIKVHESYDTPADVVDITCSTAMSAATFYHIEIGENGNSWFIFINGILRSLTTDASRAGNYTSVIQIGYNGTNYFKGKLDEFRLSNTIRHTAGFTVPVVAYSSSTGIVNVYIGSTRKLQGWTPYIKVANTATATCQGFEWTDSGWDGLSITDGSSSGGVTLATTGGKISFSSTEDTSVHKFIDGVPMYYYWFIFDGIDATTSLYYVTVDAPFQQITDYWDGVGRTIGAAFKYTTAYTDYSINVAEDEYDSLYASTYMDLASLTAFSDPNNCVILGFWEFPTAINVGVPADSVNSVANTAVSVDYWNGGSFSSVGTVDDTTSENGVSLAKSGTISWNVPDKSTIYTRTMANNTLPLYYIRLSWSQTLSASTKIYYINAVPRQKDLYGYKFPLFSQDRLMLCCDMTGDKNKIIISALDTAQVFNGDDFISIFFGGAEELTCGTTVFAMYGSSLYNITLLFKDQELWGLVQTDTGWKRYAIADVGCPAPLSLCTTVVPPIEGQQASNRCFAIWVNSTGVYTSDGRHPINVSHDIRDLFDQNADTHINLSYINSFSGFVDREKMEYHLLIALTTGTVTTLDAEYVLDLRRWQWFKVDRGTGNYLQCGVSVVDAYGNDYTYGFTDSGLCERLEYGTTFDGTAITSTLWNGDFVLDEAMTEAYISSFMPIMAAKTAGDITLTHYIDTSTTGTDYTLDATNSGYGLAFPVEPTNGIPGVFHSVKMSFTSDDEACGFEPFVVGIRYHDKREHDYYT